MKNQNNYNNIYENSYIPNQDLNFNREILNNQFSDVNTNYQYTTDILRDNIGKTTTIYASFPDSIEWRDKVLTGIIKNVGRDYILLKTNDSNKEVLISSIYINYIEF